MNPEVEEIIIGVLGVLLAKCEGLLFNLIKELLDKYTTAKADDAKPQ